MKINVVVAGDLIINGVNASQVVLTPAEFSPWKRVVIEHFDMSETSSKTSV